MCVLGVPGGVLGVPGVVVGVPGIVVGVVVPVFFLLSLSSNTFNISSFMHCFIDSGEYTEAF